MFETLASPHTAKEKFTEEIAETALVKQLRNKKRSSTARKPCYYITKYAFYYITLI